MRRMPQVIAHAGFSTKRKASHVSKEYAENLEYNSKKNSYPNSSDTRAANKRHWESYENAVNRANTRAANKRHWESYENAVNRANSSATNKRRNANTLSTSNKTMTSPVHDTDKTISRVSGNEKSGHKYITKVRTKSGKIRYIYDSKYGKHAVDNSSHASIQRSNESKSNNRTQKALTRTSLSSTKNAGGIIDTAKRYVDSFLRGVNDGIKKYW